MGLDNKPGENRAVAEFWKSWGSASSRAAGLCVNLLVAHGLTHCGSAPHSCAGLPDRRSLGFAARDEWSGGRPQCYSGPGDKSEISFDRPVKPQRYSGRGNEA